jgi:outer membrane protein OmpA-like peptidoglycan-associated protein
MNWIGSRMLSVVFGAMLILPGTTIAQTPVAAETNFSGYTQTMEGGHGLLLMESARTLGKTGYAFGVRGLYESREYKVWNGSTVKNNLTVGAVPLTIGLTDEVDLSGTVYFFNDGRIYLNNLKYGKTIGGIGSTRLGVKVRWPFEPERPFQLAGRFGAMFGTSDNQVDGLDYRWARKGTDIDGSLLQTIDLGKFVSVHLEEGYTLSGTQIYNDQWVGAAGIDIHPTDRLTLGLEANNRTFDGVGPQSVFQAGTVASRYWNGARAIGNPRYVMERKADRMKDYFVIAPSISWRMTNMVALDVGAIFNVADQPDPKETFQIAAGITISGMVKSLLDSDKDGVNDARDREQNTPRGYPVDIYGVSLDSDKDGVPDGADKQQNTPRGAVVDYRGVAIDTDNDGVPDGIDREPCTPAGCAVDRNGVALDDDGDGVANCLDKQPDTPKGCAVDKFGVALDSDGDGVPDCKDLEANTPKGCAVDKDGVALDTDGDGVPDCKDLEPNSPKGVPVDQFGRALKEQERVLVQEGFIRLNMVYFETGKATLSVKSYDALNGVAELLQKYPMLRIEIQGHTDITGTRAKNITLSQARAQAVLDYILKHSPTLNRSNFTSMGYGPDKPIATNATAEGRQLNRRVEFVVLNKEELLKLYPKK